MDPLRQRGEEKRDQIMKQLLGYPCSFQVKDVESITSKTFLESLKNHLEAGLVAGYSTSLQTASTRNLLAFVLFKLGERSRALKETENVLKMNDQGTNIVSLANKAWMHTMSKTFHEAEVLVDKLEKLQTTPEFNYLLVKAKAELAATYMRFGPMFKKHAIDAFKEVLPQAKEPEVWMWKFSLAVTYRQTLNLQHAPYACHGQYTVTHQDALKLLQQVIDSRPGDGEEAACQNLKANAYAEMGLLLNLTWDKTTKYQLCSQPKIGPMASCKKALELDNNDASVLWKCGKLHRYFRDLPKSKELLEKAVRLQPSSAAYHHLGLTYKAMATNVLHGKRKTRRGGKREKRRKQAMAYNIKSLKLDSGAAPQAVHVRKHGICGSASHPKQCQTLERIIKAVKSPHDATHFDPDEHNAQKAFENLEEAVKFSKGDNSRAVYDLALMHKASGNVEEALELFETIAQRQNSEIDSPSGLLDQVTSLEQMGLILKQLADEETDQDKRTEVTQKSERCLNDSLSLAAFLFSKTSEIQHIFGEVFQSPSALLKAAEASECSDKEKLEKKSRIFSLINNHREAFAVFRDIPEEDRDAKYYKLGIELCAKSGDYKKAAGILDGLKFTEQFSQVMELFDREDDVYSVFDIYFEAGKQALTDGPCKGKYFTDAFKYAVNPPDLQTFDESSTTRGDDSSSIQGAAAMDKGPIQAGPEPLDLILLHDEEDEDIEHKAANLEEILKKACRLRVFRSGNIRLGRNIQKCIQENTEHCRVVAVLPGKEKMLDDFEEAVSIVARSKSTVVLLTEGIGEEAIPEELKPPRHPHMTCPAELLADDLNAAGPYTEELRKALVRLVKFLVQKK